MAEYHLKNFQNNKNNINQEGKDLNQPEFS